MVQMRDAWVEWEVISTTIIGAVAAGTDEEPTELKPLVEMVDTDSLDRLMNSLRNNGNEGNVSKLAFAHNDWGVEDEADGTITIEPVGDSDQD